MQNAHDDLGGQLTALRAENAELRAAVETMSKALPATAVDCLTNADRVRVLLESDPTLKPAKIARLTGIRPDAVRQIVHRLKA